MNKEALIALARLPQGFDTAVHRIFCQRELEEEDHEFLLEHLDKLNKPTLLCWLRRKPPYPTKVAEALVERIRQQDFVFEVLDFPSDAEHIHPDALDVLAAGTRSLLPNGRWWHIVRHVLGACQTYQLVLRDQMLWRVADRLFDCRKSEDACRRELRLLLGELPGESWFEWWFELITWTESNGFMDVLSPVEILPSEVTFPFEKVAEDKHAVSIFYLRWAKKWSALPEVRTWLIERAFRAIQRGVKWSTVWQVLPHTLQDEMALQSLERDTIAPWVILTVVEAVERHEPGVWDELVFPYLDKLASLEVSKDLGPLLGKSKFAAALPSALYAIDWDDQREVPKEKRWTLFDPESILIWVFQEAPWPEPLDELFEARIWALGERYHARRGILNRLSKMSLSRERANRLLAWAIDDGRLILHGIAPETLSRLAEWADPLPADRLPSFDTFLWRDKIDEGIAVYRKLGGTAADERLRAWVDAVLEPPGYALYAIARMRHVPDLVTEEMRAALARVISTTSFLDLRTLKKEAPELVSDERLLAAALECAENLDERWCYEELPEFAPVLADAIRKRARILRDETEWGGLMSWLTAQNEPPQSLLELIMGRLDKNADSWRALLHLGQLFNNGTRWTKFGPRVLEWLLDKRGVFETIHFVERTPKTAGAAKDPCLLGMQEALAVVLIRRAQNGIVQGNEQLASAALSGLTALHPPTRLSGKIHAMQKRARMSPAITELVKLCSNLFRHDGTGEANWTDARMALMLYDEQLRRGEALKSPEIESD